MIQTIVHSKKGKHTVQQLMKLPRSKARRKVGPTACESHTPWMSNPRALATTSGFKP